MSGLSARILPLVRPWCPEPAKEIWRKLRWRREFLKTVRDGVVPAFCDFVGYETLVEILMGRRIIALPGNFIEIGAFLGGGTAKLAKIAALCGKKVWVVDIFDPNFDKTATVDGMAMNDMYRGFVRYASQEQIFRWVTGPYAQHLKVLKGDSRLVKVPLHAQFSFGFIDGNHDPAWVDIVPLPGHRRTSREGHRHHHHESAFFRMDPGRPQRSFVQGVVRSHNRSGAHHRNRRR